MILNILEKKFPLSIQTVYVKSSIMEFTKYMVYT